VIEQLHARKRFSKGIVRPPSLNFATGITSVDLGLPNYELALRQHDAYCTALEQCGLELIRLDADERYPDSAFVEDTAIVTDRVSIVTRPGADSRAGEVHSIKRVLSDFQFPLREIKEPGTLDGGDVCGAGEHFFIGVSARTNENGAKQLADFLASFDYSASLIDIREAPGILHLKSGLAYLGEDRLLVIDSLRDRLEFRDYEIISVPPGEEYAANCIRVNQYVLIAEGYQRVEEILSELGYNIVSLGMSEFQKMDGGLSCLSLRF
jgi:dimethylargininase